jgi:uncharacterized membrane protein
MFRIQTSDTGRLKRIAAVGSGGILLGLFLTGFNLVRPLLAGGEFGASNVVFGLFGLVTVVLVTHPTYQAARELDAS